MEMLVRVTKMRMSNPFRETSVSFTKHILSELIVNEARKWPNKSRSISMKR